MCLAQGPQHSDPGSAVRYASVARHVTDCATQPGPETLAMSTTYTKFLHGEIPSFYFQMSYMVCTCQWRIQSGFGGWVAGTSSATSVFKYPMKMKSFGLSETKLFNFHGIFKKN